MLQATLPGQLPAGAPPGRAGAAPAARAVGGHAGGREAQGAIAMAARTVATGRASHPCAVAALAALGAAAAAEPRIELRLAAFPGVTFPNFSSVILPCRAGPARAVDPGRARRDPGLDRAREAERAADDAVRRGEPAAARRAAAAEGGADAQPGVPAAADRGERRRRLRPGRDEDGLPGAVLRHARRRPPPHRAPRRCAPARTAREVAAPEQKLPPRVVFTSEWPPRTAETLLTLLAEAEDVEGISRLVVEVNGSDVDEIVMQNGIPVRKHQGWMTSGKAPARSWATASSWPSTCP